MASPATLVFPTVVWADLFLSSSGREGNPDWGQTNISECRSCSEARAVFLNPSDGPVSVGASASSCFFHTGVFRHFVNFWSKVARNFRFPKSCLGRLVLEQS